MATDITGLAVPGDPLSLKPLRTKLDPWQALQASVANGRCVVSAVTIGEGVARPCQPPAVATAAPWQVAQETALTAPWPAELKRGPDPLILKPAVAKFGDAFAWQVMQSPLPIGTCCPEPGVVLPLVPDGTTVAATPAQAFASP